MRQATRPGTRPPPPSSRREAVCCFASPLSSGAMTAIGGEAPNVLQRADQPGSVHLIGIAGRSERLRVEARGCVRSLRRVRLSPASVREPFVRSLKEST
jgi:hypothetical protein